MPETPDIPEKLPLANAAETLPSAPESEMAASAEDCAGEPISQERDMGHPAASEEAVEAAEVRANEDETKEEKPVIEVHEPEVGVHTWKDFWIHLGTITVGLLIAISLEQSVEKLHQLHERHELEAALRTEAEHNKEIAEFDFAGYDEEMTWLLALHEDIGRMLATGGKANLAYRPVRYHVQFPNGLQFTSTGDVFETVVWDTADEDNRLALLPDEEARAYSGQYHYTGARLLELQIAIRDDYVRQNAFEAQFGVINAPTTPVLAKMSPAELKQYDALVMQTFTGVRIAKNWLIALYGGNEALRQGHFDFPSTYREVGEAVDRFKTSYPKLAQGVAALDAERDKAAAAEKGKR